MSETTDVEAPAAQAAEGAAQILDQRYRPYSGPRRGLAGAMRAVVASSVRFTLGLGRPARHKFLPWLAVVIALVPAVVFVGIATVLDIDLVSEQILPDYHQYYGFIQVALFFFCGIVVPEILVVGPPQWDVAAVPVDAAAPVELPGLEVDGGGGDVGRHYRRTAVVPAGRLHHRGIRSRRPRGLARRSGPNPWSPALPSLRRSLPPAWPSPA